MKANQMTERLLSEPPRYQDERSPFERDLGRVIHSSAFRRLQAKTQVLGISEGDFHRTRLTHSLEVAQIGRGICRQLWRHKAEGHRLLDEALIETICLAHDLGHPPFGHVGEAALNYEMRKSGGFEGNGQTLRLVARLETHTPELGLNLTRRTLLGLLKYPAKYSTCCTAPYPRIDPRNRLAISVEGWMPPKCYMDSEHDIVRWLVEPLSSKDRRLITATKGRGPKEHRKPTQKSFDCSIMDAADDIAYAVHDIEDGVVLGLIGRDQLADAIRGIDTKWLRRHGLGDFVANLMKRETRKAAIGALTNALIVSVETRTDDRYESELFRYRAYFTDLGLELADTLKEFARNTIMKTAEVQTLEYRGRQSIMAIFEALSSDPGGLLPTKVQDLWRAADKKSKLRVIADYISGMTDSYITKLFERLFIPRHGTVFDRL